MKAYIYTLEDEYLGIPLTIEAELVDWQDSAPPDIVINEISYNENPLSLWCLSEAFIKHCRDRVFQTWCFEGTNNRGACAERK